MKLSELVKTCIKISNAYKEAGLEECAEIQQEVYKKLLPEIEALETEKEELIKAIKGILNYKCNDCDTPQYCNNLDCWYYELKRIYERITKEK